MGATAVENRDAFPPLPTLGGGTAGAERLSSARRRANCGCSRSPTGTRCQKMVSRLVLLHPCSRFLFFLGFSSPLVTSGGSSLTPRPGITQHRPLDLRVCLFSLLPTSILCAGCPLPPPSPRGHSLGATAKREAGRGLCHRPRAIAVGLFPLQKAAAAVCPCPHGRRDPGTSPLSASLGMCWASREVPGARRRAGENRKKQEVGGGNQQLNSNPQTRPPPKKRKLCGTWNCDFMEF